MADSGKSLQYIVPLRCKRLAGRRSFGRLLRCTRTNTDGRRAWPDEVKRIIEELWRQSRKRRDVVKSSKTSLLIKSSGCVWRFIKLWTMEELSGVLRRFEESRFGKRPQSVCGPRAACHRVGNEGGGWGDLTAVVSRLVPSKYWNRSSIQ